MDMPQDHHRCFSKILWAVEQLQGRIDHAHLEAVADLIMQTMTGPWRFFHTPEHIFEVGGDQDPIEVLSALFHDLVYVQVDTGMNINICRYIAPFVEDRGGQLWLLEQENRLLELAIGIFGLEKRQPLLIMHGQNEFLSALVCLQTLKDALSFGQLAEITACIEATIPFRGKNASGDATGYIVEQTPSDLLMIRLIAVNAQFGLGWTNNKLREVVKRSVRVANRDIGNFASPNSAHFLDNTWNLLPETNHDLTRVNAYTVQGYRLSLQKMEGFMNFLSPELIFRQYDNEPLPSTYANLLKTTDHNLQVARLYLGAKLVAIGLIEGLAMHLGKEVPLSTMMGELPQRHLPSIGLEQFLPSAEGDHQPRSIVEAEVLALLEQGRTADAHYDVRHSPVATYLVKSIGFEAMGHLLIRVKQFFKGEITGEQWLKEIEAPVLAGVLTATLKLFDARRHHLYQILPPV